MAAWLVGAALVALLAMKNVHGDWACRNAQSPMEISTSERGSANICRVGFPRRTHNDRLLQDTSHRSERHSPWKKLSRPDNHLSELPEIGSAFFWSGREPIASD